MCRPRHPVAGPSAWKRLGLGDLEGGAMLYLERERPMANEGGEPSGWQIDTPRGRDVSPVVRRSPIRVLSST